jgi:hypothetical protein
MDFGDKNFPNSYLNLRNQLPNVMKAKLLPFALCAFLIFACSEDETAYECSSCVNTPEASAANDSNGKGIYKGLIIGSSGTIKFDIANSGTTYTALLILDGEEYELWTDEDYDVTTGFQGVFYGTLYTTDDIEITIYIDKFGAITVGAVIIPDHPSAILAIYKEFSDELVTVYEGTFDGDGAGVFNMIVRGNAEWLVRARETGDDGYISFYGSLSSGVMTCMQCGDVDITGKIKGDEASGNWSEDGGGSGSWKGKRTL